MKLSATKISVLFIMFVSALIGYVHFHNRTEYTIANNFSLNNYQYEPDFVLTINGSIAKRSSKAEYDRILQGLLGVHNHFEVVYETARKQVLLKSAFVKIRFFYTTADKLSFQKIEINTTNRSYCEN